MVEINVNPPAEEPISTSAVQPSSADPSVAGNVAQANKTTSKSFDMSTSIGSLEELRQKAPEVYQKMMEGIAYTVVQSMQRHQEHLEKIWRENRQENGG